MIINKTADGNKMTIALEGRLDTSTAPELQELVAGLEGVTDLTFDLEKLMYISSAGLRVLMIAKKGIKEVSIININEDIKEIFDITGFSTIFNIQ
ncbi:MAG: STAS domain-containing protein [Clostridia bacterium]|nr:STAS domain-containing protein [Clostridia bacterium]